MRAPKSLDFRPVTSLALNSLFLADTENRPVVAKQEGDLGRDGLGVQDQQMQSIIHRVGKQQGPTV